MQDVNPNKTQKKDKNEIQQKKDIDETMKPPLSTKVLKSSKNVDCQCRVCNVTFNNYCHLKYHIRRNHFNLRGKVPYCELKGINQVWFEKVINSEDIVEMKKTGANRLVIRKLKSNNNVQIHDINSEEIDLTDLYPVKNDEKDD